MINLYDILEASNGQLFGEPSAQVFTRFSLDADQITDSSIFVAIKNDFGDTHAYMEQAVQNGAAGILCTRPPDFDTDDVSVIVVRDTEVALVAWARWVLERMRTRVIAVTGTTGKSTTISAITKVLSTAYHVLGRVPDQQKGRLGIPLALAGLEPTHDFVVLELTVAQANEMSQLLNIVPPNMAVITNIGWSYTESFTSLDQIAREYAVLVQSLPPDGLAVLNFNDDLVRGLGAETKARSFTVSADRFGADFMAYNIVPGLTQTGFDLRYGSSRYVGRWAPLLGVHQIYSLLCAIAVGAHHKIPVDTALRSLTELVPLPGRMSPLAGKGGALIIDDTYDATPDATLAALDWLESVAHEDTRTIFVFGDIENLGDNSIRSHRKIGHRTADFVDRVVTIGAQASHTGRAARDSGMPDRCVTITYSLKDALTTLTQDMTLTENDILLVKGGAQARMELVVKSLLAEEKDQEKLPRAAMARSATIAPQRPLRPSWVEIDREAIAGNVRLIKQLVGDDVALMATVKADAYGHGAVAVSQIALNNGASYLAVASISEALELRNGGIEAPILVLSYTPIYAVREAIRNDITVTVYDLDLVRAFDRVARESGKKLRVHVKVDTGMGRLGVLPDKTVVLFRYLIAMDHIEVEGIYTHFSAADDDMSFTDNQAFEFRKMLKPLGAAGIKFAYRHMSNSAGTLLGADYHMNMVRAGLLLYGYSPSTIAPKPEELRPAMSWKTAIAQVKTLPPGHAVGYGNTYTTPSEERVAVIPVGYADGFRRTTEPQGQAVLVRGQRAPVRGRVSMEKTVISVDHIPGVSIGDEVILLGTHGDETIDADEMAGWYDTISYDVLTGILPRVLRR